MTCTFTLCPARADLKRADLKVRPSITRSLRAFYGASADAVQGVPETIDSSTTGLRPVRVSECGTPRGTRLNQPGPTFSGLVPMVSVPSPATM